MILLGLLVAHAVSASTLEERLRASVEKLASVDSRVTGYPGHEKVADDLVGTLRELGAQVYEHRFLVPIPMDEGFSLTAQNDTIRVYGMWPNLVRTPTLPPEGIGGTLLYGGNGDLEGLDGKPLSGRIVVLEYKSGREWVTLFQLGVRAVIFLEAGEAHRKEGALKFLNVPADLPRFYVAGTDAERVRALAKGEVSVKMRGRMSWRPVQGRNVVGVMEGTDPVLGKEAVILSAYYDAMSPVPALAPGAEQACSAAGLLELVQVLSTHRPKRTVFVVFASGHFENVAGMRHFVPLMQVAAGRREPDVRAWTGGERALIDRMSAYQIRLFVGLDLLTGSDRMSVMKPQPPYRTKLSAPPITNRVMSWVSAYEDSVLLGRKILSNGLRKDLSRQGLGILPEQMAQDASVAALAGCPALLFITLNDIRAKFDSPSDTPEGMVFEGLGEQVRFLSYLMPALINDEKLPDWGWGNDVFGSLQGEVVHYGPRSYLPDQATGGALVRVRRRNPTLAGVRGDFWTVADDSGRFEVPGLETTRILYTKKVRIEAYGLDGVTGAVTDAPDWGVNGEGRLPERALKVLMDSEREEVQVVTAQVAGLTLFETFDPRNLLTPERVEVIDASLEAEPIKFGACLPLTTPEVGLFGYTDRVGSWVEPVAVLFARPGIRLKVIMSTGLYGLGKRLLLLNGQPGEAEGVGYEVRGGVLTATSYRVAQDMTRLNRMRIDRLEAHGVRNRRLMGFQVRAETLIAEAEQARQAYRHRDFLDRSRRAWAYAVAAYRDVSSTQGGVIQGALFLLAALIPFAHFAERLIFGFSDLKHQMFGYFGFFGAGFVALRYLHPAFDLSISPAVILLGFVILTLGLFVTGLGMSRLNRELKDLVSGRRGRERSDLQRSGTLLTSVSVGLAHLRRRPLRTGLTCVTLVLLTFSVLSFTSIRATLRTNRIEVGQNAPYEGVLVRLPGWKTMEISAYRLMADRFGKDRVAPRAWMVGGSISSRFQVQRADTGRVFTEVMGIVGLTAQEARLVKPQAGLDAGVWFGAEEEDACLLPQAVADSLRISSKDVGRARVRIFGEVFRVVGVLKNDALEAPDLNGEPLTPLHPEAQGLAQVEARSVNKSGQLPTFDHLGGKEVIVLPFDAVMRWDRAAMASIGILFEDAEGPISELSETLDLTLFAGLKGKRYLINTVGVASVSGLGDLLVPIAIAALIVLNTMMGAVYERTKEIGTFNAVGLAPKHVSGLFMAEASAYATVGGVLGYILGQTAAQSIGRWGLLAGLELNYSSLSAVLSLGLVMGVVLLSALYPARMAGQICTPGIERRWVPPRPEGDVLKMYLPFTLVRDDALGMAAFLAEFWASHQEQSIGAGFYVESLSVDRVGNRLDLGVVAWLAPFDQGVTQAVKLGMSLGEDGYYIIDVEIRRKAGDYETWRRVNRTFLDDLRKQFLVWRTLSREDRETYVAELDRWVA